MATYTKFEGPSTDFVVKKGTSSLMVYDTKGTFLSSSTYSRILFYDGMYEWDAKSGKLVPVYPHAPDPPASQQVAAVLASDPITHISLHYASGRVDMKAVVKE